MTPMKRRLLLAAGATLPAGLLPRKPQAASGLTLPDPSTMRQTPGDQVPELHFTLADGTPQTLADFAGQGVVLNLWATWCVPCVAEMPALARLAELMRGLRVAILPLSSDRGGAPAVERFYHDKGLTGLPVLLDPRGDAARSLQVRGIPTTLLIDSKGRERGRLEGAVDWAGPDALAAVRLLVP